MRSLLTLLAGVILSACSVGPDYEAPTINLNDRYSILMPLSKASGSDLYWWHEFHDPVLNALIARGFQENLDVAVARERVAEAEAILRRDSVSPSGNAELDARGNSNAGNTASAEVSASFSLAGRTAWASRAAAQRLEAAELGRKEAQRLLLSELTGAYINMRFLQRSIQTRQQDLASRRRTLRDLNTQLEAGAATQLDVLRARSLVSETQSDVPRISADIVRQRNRISTLLGVPVGALGIDLGYKGKQPVPVGAHVSGVPADLLRARPDIRIAERNYAAAVSDLGVATASRYPSLNLSGLVTAPLKSGSWNESIVAGLTVPLFSQPALAAGEDVAASRAQQAYLQWRRGVLVAVEEVENALASYQAARQSVAASSELVSLNDRSLNLSRRLLIDGGNTTVLDVIDRERSVSAARSALARDTRDLAQAYVQLRIALGIGHEEVSDLGSQNTRSEPEVATPEQAAGKSSVSGT